MLRSPFIRVHKEKRDSLSKLVVMKSFHGKFEFISPTESLIVVPGDNLIVKDLARPQGPVTVLLEVLRDCGEVSSNFPA